MLKVTLLEQKFPFATGLHKCEDTDCVSLSCGQGSLPTLPFTSQYVPFKTKHSLPTMSTLQWCVYLDLTECRKHSFRLDSQSCNKGKLILPVFIFHVFSLKLLYCKTSNYIPLACFWKLTLLM